MAFYTKTVQEMIAEGVNLFDFSYTLYNNSKKQELQDAFIRKYYFYEMGYETVSMFKYALKEKWLLILPKYNKLWTENEKTLDVFKDFDVEGQSNTVLKDTPLTEYDEDNDYASAKQKNNTQSTGRNQSEIDLLENYNKKLRNITEQYLDEFIKLFMGIM